MTRDEIDSDIAALINLRDDAKGDDERAALDRAIARLRADLARLDGPVDGCVRVRAVVCVNECGSWTVHGIDGDSDNEMITDSKECWSASDRIAFSFLVGDAPLPRAVEIQGEVER